SARGRATATGQDRDEFLAAVAAEQVALLQRGAQRARHLAQAGIAAGVAVAVVDRLEVVQVDEQHRDRLARARTLGEGPRQPVVYRAPVEAAGQRVEFGRAAQLDRGHGLVQVQQRLAREVA